MDGKTFVKIGEEKGDEYTRYSVTRKTGALKAALEKTKTTEMQKEGTDKNSYLRYSSIPVYEVSREIAIY